MSDITLNIDGREVQAKEGMTVLEAARSADIFIPTLCYNEMLEPYGGCRLCTVEAETRGRTKLVAACLFPVQADLIVRTRSETVDKIRKLILEFLLAHAPDSEQMKELAAEYGADKDRFPKSSSFCILCGLCVRYCAEVKKKNVIAFVDNGSGGTGDWVWQPGDGEVLIARGRLPEGVHLTRTSFSKNRLRFNSQGHLMGINRSIYLKNSDDLTRKITVYASGNCRVN